MNNDFYVLAITALLPLMAGMLVLQKNPYHALVIRGILGAIAALVYALFGAADVALTEALVGTMLSITLYAIAVRSALTVQVGLYCQNPNPQEPAPQKNEQQIAEHLSQNSPGNSMESTLLQTLKAGLCNHHLRIEPVPFQSYAAATAALKKAEIHLLITSDANTPDPALGKGYRVKSRLPRLYDILQSAPWPECAQLELARPASKPASPMSSSTIQQV